jgi:hypothetical protein
LICHSISIVGRLRNGTDRKTLLFAKNKIQNPRLGACRAKLSWQ